MSEIENSYTKELFEFAIKNNKINLDDIAQEMKKEQRDKILQEHNHKISLCSDGRWMTRVDDASAPKGMRKIVKKDRNALLDALVQYYEKGSTIQKDITLRQLYPRWLEHKKLYTTAVTTIVRIECDWRTYYDLETDRIVNGRKLKEPSAPVPIIIDTPVYRLTKIQMDEWAHTLIKAYNMKKTCYYNCTMIIRQMLHYAVDLEIIRNSPFDDVRIDAARMFRHILKKPDATQVFSTKEVIAIKEIAEEDYQKRKDPYQLTPLGVLFQFQTGIRVGELYAVRFEDVEKPEYIHIQRMFRRVSNTVIEHTKTAYGDRQVILTQAAREIIREARKRHIAAGLPCTGYIFSMDEKPVQEYIYVRLYERYCKKAGIMVKSSHKVRKTFISALLDGGCNINTVRALVGHADERTTLGCYCFDRRDESEKIRLIEAALA